MDTCGLSLLLKAKSPPKTALLYARNSEISARAWSEHLTEVERPLLDSDTESHTEEAPLQNPSSNTCDVAPGSDHNESRESVSDSQEVSRVMSSKVVEVSDYFTKPQQEHVTEEAQPAQGIHSRRQRVLAMLVSAVICCVYVALLACSVITSAKSIPPALRLALRISSIIMGCLSCWVITVWIIALSSKPLGSEGTVSISTNVDV